MFDGKGLITGMLRCSSIIVIFRHFIICQESENIHVLEHHLKYILSPTLCDADIDNFMLKIFKLNIIIISEFSIFLLNFVLDENPIFCGCQFDGPKVKNWQN